MKKLKLKNALLICLTLFLETSLNDVEVSSDAAAAVKQQSDGQKQTFISSQSKAKANKEGSAELTQQRDAGPRSAHPTSGEQLSVEKELFWGYENTPHSYGPDNWPIYYPICNGSFQSPIPLEAESNNEAKKYVDPLHIESSNDKGLLYGHILNDGHTFGMKVDENLSAISISGGPLNDQTYRLYQLHFHFSCSNKETGSEHSLDGLKYAAELHLVFCNKKYASCVSALDKPDGMVVLAFFIKSGSSLNHGTFLINRYLIDIQSPGSATYVTYGLALYDLIPKLSNGPASLNYVFYRGSLSTPPCYESVLWILFQDATRVPLKDIESWRRLKGLGTSRLCNNFRPLQAINGRQTFFVNPSESN